MKKLKIGDLVEINKTYYDLKRVGNKFVIKSIEKCYTMFNNERCPDRYDLSICPGNINGVCYGYTRGFALTKIGEKSINSNIILKDI